MSLRSMTIKGIRSFGVEDNEEQKIKFRDPLTLIVGRNGAGKTTLIECLKYATTGKLPGFSRNGAFVHDPRLVGRSEVIAEVSLTFDDLQGRKYDVKRILNAKMLRNGNVTASTRDSHIVEHNANRRTSVSAKKADTDEKMVSLLGVSKSVLENVIFCHQEDSNWPLSEGKILKEKFDEIFDATRYNESLDRIKKTKKDMETQNDLDQKDLVRLEEHNELAQEKGQSLEELKEQLRIETAQAKKAEKDLRDLEKKLEKNENLLDKINTMRLQIRDDETTLRGNKQERDHLKKQIRTKFKGTKAELSKQKSSLQKEIKQKEKLVTKDQNEIKNISQEISCLSKKETELASKEGKMQQEYDSIEKKKEERNTLLQELAKESGLDLGQKVGKKIPDSMVASFQKKAESWIDGKTQALKNKQIKIAEDIDGCDKELHKTLEKRAKLEAEMESQEKSVSKKRQEAKEIETLDIGSDEMSALDEMLQQKEKSWRDAENSRCIETMGQDLASLVEKKVEYTQKLKKAASENGTRRRNEAARVALFQSEVIPGLKKSVAEMNSKIDALHTAGSRKEDVVFSSLELEIRNISSKIETLEEALPRAENPDLGVDDYQIQDLLQLMLDCDKEIDEKREQIETQRRHLFDLKESVLKLQVEKLELSLEMQKKGMGMPDLKTIKQEIDDLEESMLKSEKSIHTLNSQKERLESRKKGINTKGEEEKGALSENIQKLTSKLNEITKLSNEIKEYFNSGRSKLRDCNAKDVDSTEKKRADCETRLQNLQVTVDSTFMQIAESENKFEMLEENQKLMERNEDITKLEAKIVTLRADVQKLDLPKAQRENDSLKKEREKCMATKVQCDTSRNIRLEQVESLEKELDSDNLKNAEEKYKDCMCKVTVAKILVSDLDKYCKAMHSAILKYHNIKMLEINRKIKEIWQKMYRGHDIDHVEIVSEPGKTQTSRTVYNYRVVKCSGGKQIDIRGRCSAGQKVIASLVIRLALAETFCINCGILALDEPTTNLDQHHIKSLAKSLIRIARERETQTNLQLLIITHSEEFAERLGREGYINHFYRIEKIEGKSLIRYEHIGTVSSQDGDEQT